MTIFLVFLAAYTLSQFYRSFLAVIAPELARELSIGLGDLGLISAVWFVAFAAGQIPVGMALDRFGPRRTVPLMMSLAALGALLFATARSGLDCAAAMALIGLGCAPIYMGALYMFGRVFEPSRFALLSSWLIAIGSAGNLLGATPLALASERFGWRGAFIGLAMITAAAVVAVALLLKDPPRLNSSRDTRGLFAGIGEVVSIRALWPILPLVFVSYAVVIAERALWVGPYFSDVHGLAPIARGNAVLIFAVAMSIGALVSGPLDQWLGTRKWVVVTSTTLCGVAFLVLGLLSGLGVTAAIALYMAIGVTGHSYGVLMAHGRSYLPDHLLGRGITLLNLLFIGGAGVAQIVSTRFFAHFGNAGGTAPAEAYSAVHIAFGLALLVASAIYLRSRDRI